MKKNAVLVASVALLLIMVLVNTTLAEHEHKGKPSNAEILQKKQKLQMPFIANEGQIDERVAFYTRTFGGTVFVTKDGNIVYSLPHAVAHASPLVHYDIDKNKTGYTGLTGFPRKEGQCIVHRTLCAMYPYCPWNLPVYYSETNSLICHSESNSPVCHSERSEESHVNNSQPEIQNPKSVNSISANPNSVIQNLSPTSVGEPKSGIVLREEFVGAKVKTIQGEQPSVSKERIKFVILKDKGETRNESIRTYSMQPEYMQRQALHKGNKNSSSYSFRPFCRRGNF